MFYSLKLKDAIEIGSLALAR